MFGSKLKTWMENYIGRPKKKVQAEAQKGKATRNGAGGLILESSESLAQSDTGISSGSQQVLSSSATDSKEGYSTATMDSDRSGLIHCNTAISLPSPESAYSTGYSTDETSPGGTAPPEYYINIRTGKHYFHSPAPTPTSPHPDTPFPHSHPNQHSHTNHFPPKHPPFPPNLTRLPPPPPQPSPHPPTSTSRTKSYPRPLSHLSPSPLQHPSTSSPTHFQTPPLPHSPRTHFTSFNLFLRSPATEPTTTKPFSPKKSPKPKKWFKQPFHRFAHRRTDSCEANVAVTNAGKQPEPAKGLCPFSSQDVAASPRQRNRIKTNPWLPTAPTLSPLLQNLHPIFPNPALPRNRSCSNTPLQNRKAPQPDPPKPPLPQHLRHDLHLLDNPIDSSDRSEEDLTLNEMMGTYNESYVYDKETDILSDSDPTDCDDYDSDSEAEKGGDERDSHDDELDFIDNASATDSDDSFPPNTGRCTYHHQIASNANSFLGSAVDRRQCRKNSEQRRSLRRGQEVKGRRERRRQGRVWSKCEEEERKKQGEGWMRGRGRNEVDEGTGESSLRRMLLRRVMGRSVRKGSGGCGGVVGGSERWKETGDEGSPRVELELGLEDQEADERYRELIVEAENMFESLRNSPLVKGRKKMDFLDGTQKGESEKAVEVRKEAEKIGYRRSESKESEMASKKSPKTLALNLHVESPKKPGGLHFEVNKKSSFKAKSSAHSPLDPLGPTFRNFAVFHPAPGCDSQVLTTSSDDSDPTDRLTPKTPPATHSPLVPFAFQSLDLGKPLTSYCPQSEPVKRKIYSCSKTYDRLLRHLENTPPIFEDPQPRKLPRPNTHLPHKHSQHTPSIPKHILTPPPHPLPFSHNLTLFPSSSLVPKKTIPNVSCLINPQVS